MIDINLTTNLLDTPNSEIFINIYLLQFITNPQIYWFQVDFWSPYLLEPPTIRDGRVRIYIQIVLHFGKLRE